MVNKTSAPDIVQLLSERRTVHEFAPEPVALDKIRRAVAAALAAPNHRMTEPWRFTWVGPETRRQVLQVALAIKQGEGSLSDEERGRLESKILAPPGLLVLRQVLAPRPDVRQEDYASLACAAHTIMLALWADGIGTKWSTGGITQASGTYQALGVDASRESIVGFLWVGYEAPGSASPKPRRKLGAEQVLAELP